MTKFLADSTVGKLVKWLRIMGYDTVVHTGAADRVLLDRGVREDRVVLSRKKELAGRQFRGILLVIDSDRVSEQIDEIIQRLRLTPRQEDFFTRCLSCNDLLGPVCRENVKDRVPPYVFKTQHVFVQCSRCGSIFWPGTHQERMTAILNRHNPTDRP
ncbi:MAG: hypothetical protein AVO39_06960 [delta proteobacterium MLS_D]|nr:MAG: hypothetical protein AVO39_06960 [delta proteobacterium MLS_D]